MLTGAFRAPRIDYAIEALRAHGRTVEIRLRSERERSVPARAGTIVHPIQSEPHLERVLAEIEASNGRCMVAHGTVSTQVSIDEMRRRALRVIASQTEAA